MRKWSLVPSSLFCLLLAVVVVACSAADGGPTTSHYSWQQGSTADDASKSTTTLAPASWEALTPAGDPPAGRLGGSLVAASKSQGFLLFGGWGGASEYFGDLWRYDPTANAWSELEPRDVSPSPRASQAMAYDPIADRLIVFGGYNGVTYFDDTWAYDLPAGVWAELEPAGARPTARLGHSLVYEPESKIMIMFGGYDGTTQYNDTWAYDPAANTWTELRPLGTIPAGRDSQVVAYDPDNKVMVLFGGWSTTRQFDDTWVYDPSAGSWIQLYTRAPAPKARAFHQMVYDTSIGKFVLVAGGNSNGTFGDTWLFDLTERSWTAAQASGEPPSARAGHSLVYDSSARQVLLFGGSDGMGAYFQDLWRLKR